MRRRFIADEISANRAALIGAHAAHLVRVLRARLGQEFDIAADDRVRTGKIVGLADDRVEFELGEEVESATQAQITLLLAVFKFDRMEWAIEKCTELSVARIVPVIAARTDPHLAAAAAKRAERWRRLARGAAEQSRRASPPEITAAMQLKKLGAPPFSPQAKGWEFSFSTGIVLAESENQTTLQQALAAHSGGGLALAVGPEGGWTPEELRHFADIGWSAASLGPTILRAETAAIAALAITMASLAG